MRNIFKIVKEGFENISPNNFVHHAVKTKTLSEISQVVFQEKVSSKVIPGKAFLKIKWCIEWGSLKYLWSTKKKMYLTGDGSPLKNYTAIHDLP